MRWGVVGDWGIIMSDNVIPAVETLTNLATVWYTKDCHRGVKEHCYCVTFKFLLGFDDTFDC